MYVLTLICITQATFPSLCLWCPISHPAYKNGSAVSAILQLNLLLPLIIM